MSDLDFEELDRAVNSLISGGSDSNTTTPPAVTNNNPTPAVDNQPVVPTIPATVAPTIEPTSQDPVSAPVTASPQPSSTPVAQSLAGQRGSGWFMDVIHPSSDMRTSATTVAPAKAAPQPPQPLKSPQPPSFRPISSRPSIPAPTIEPKLQVVVPEKPQDSEPAELSQESPFISGAKVEKRPLGAFSVTVAEPTVELSPSGEVVEKTSEKPEQVAMTEMEPPLPEELQGDLLEIESGNSSKTNKTNEPEIKSEEIIPEGVSSIVQQYKEEPSKKNEKSGSIYDTSVYHKPLKSEPKKKTGWLWVLWIVLLLIVGIGAGAVAYFYVLPLIK